MPITKPRVSSGYRFMPDNDDSSAYEEVSDRESTFEPEEEVQNYASTNEAYKNDVNIMDMAKELLDDTSNIFNLSTTVQDLINYSTVNTKKYEKTRTVVEQRLFDTIEKYGNNTLKKLLPCQTR
jgi:hypothetical protein